MYVEVIKLDRISDFDFGQNFCSKLTKYTPNHLTSHTTGNNGNLARIDN